ncbi:hypothetical protein BDZ97DRAFT_1914424 [Flammula alnicola]|nr:hypothetical protein BDZ97DRAFT_1914424 [Flammula alnicola]
MGVLTPTYTGSETLRGDEQWSDSLDVLERELAAYRELIARGAPQNEINDAAARVASALRFARTEPQSDVMPTNVVGPPPAPEKPKKLKRGSKWGSKMDADLYAAFPDSHEDNVRENPAKQMGRGLLLILGTPLAVAGMGVYACGLIAEGTGTILKGIGSLGKLPLSTAVRAKPKKFTGPI